MYQTEHASMNERTPPAIHGNLGIPAGPCRRSLAWAGQFHKPGWIPIEDSRDTVQRPEPVQTLASDHRLPALPIRPLSSYGFRESKRI
jgi:hypothetical protein